MIKKFPEISPQYVRYLVFRFQEYQRKTLLPEELSGASPDVDPLYAEQVSEDDPQVQIAMKNAQAWLKEELLRLSPQRFEKLFWGVESGIGDKWAQALFDWAKKKQIIEERTASSV